MSWTVFRPWIFTHDFLSSWLKIVVPKTLAARPVSDVFLWSLYSPLTCCAEPHSDMSGSPFPWRKIKRVSSRFPVRTGMWNPSKGEIEFPESHG